MSVKNLAIEDGKEFPFTIENHGEHLENGNVEEDAKVDERNIYQSQKRMP